MSVVLGQATSPPLQLGNNKELDKMIRFSHKANSWQVDTPQGWVNIAPAQARFMVDRGVLLLTTGN